MGTFPEPTGFSCEIKLALNPYRTAFRNTSSFQRIVSRCFAVGPSSSQRGPAIDGPWVGLSSAVMQLTYSRHVS